MGYTHAFPRRTAVGRKAAEADDPGLHKARIAFLFLLVFTVLIYARPADMIWSLQVIPMAEIAAICAVAGYVIARLQGNVPFIWTTEVKIVFAMTLFFVAGVPFAFWRSNSLDVLTNEWFKTLLIFFLVTQVVFTVDRVRKVLWVIILSELIVALYSLKFRSGAVDVGGRMRGVSMGLLAGNYLGVAAATTMPFMAALMVRSKSFIQTSLLMATLGSVAWMVVLTASRGGLMAVIFSLLLIWFTVLRGTMKARALGAIFGICLIVALALAPATFWSRISTLWDKDSYAASSVGRSAGESEFQRKALLERSLRWTIENPILGLGVGNFSIKSGTVGGAQDWKGTHNSFTQVSSEGGIPAFILFMSLLVLSVRNMRRLTQWCKERTDPEALEISLMARATQVSLIAFMFSAFFAHLAYDYHLYYLAGLGVALQSAYARFVKRQGGPIEEKPQKNGRLAGAVRGPAL